MAHCVVDFPEDGEPVACAPCHDKSAAFHMEPVAALGASHIVVAENVFADEVATSPVAPGVAVILVPGTTPLPTTPNWAFGLPPMLLLVLLVYEMDDAPEALAEFKVLKPNAP